MFNLTPTMKRTALSLSDHDRCIARPADSGRLATTDIAARCWRYALTGPNGSY